MLIYQNWFQMKDSFIMYVLHYNAIKALSREQKGELLEAIYIYQGEGKVIELSSIVNMAFSFIKNQLDIDNVKYLKICERNKKNGVKGGRKKEPKKPSGLSGNPKNPNAPDNDNDNVLFIKQKSDIEIKYEKFNTWLKENTPSVLKMKEPISLKQFTKLYNDSYFTNEIVYEKLKAMHNKPSLTKTYTSAYSTLTNWVKKEYEKAS